MNTIRRFYGKTRKWRPVFIIAAAFVSALVLAQGRPGEAEFSIEQARGIFPDASRTEPLGNGVYGVIGHEGRVKGFIVHGPPPGAGITGYAGEVPFIIGLDPEHTIKAVHMLPGRETPSYAETVAGSLRQAWSGLGPAEAVEKRVEAVTGATHTSRALIDGVGESLRVFSPAAAESRMPLPRPAAVLAAEAATLAFLAASFAYFLLRFSSSLFSLFLKAAAVAIPGFLSAAVLSAGLFGGWIEGYFGMAGNRVIVAVAVLALGAPLFTGRNFYCYNFCPFGAAQELAGKLSRGKWRMGRKANLFLSRLRLILILSCLAALYAGAGANLYLVEPFGAFRWHHASMFTRILAAVFVLLALKIPRPWCRICPTGGVIDGLKLRARSRAGA